MPYAIRSPFAFTALRKPCAVHLSFTLLLQKASGSNGFAGPGVFGRLQSDSVLGVHGQRRSASGGRVADRRSSTGKPALHDPVPDDLQSRHAVRGAAVRPLRTQFAGIMIIAGITK